MKNLRHLLATAALLATACTCTPKPAPETPEEKDNTVAVTGVAITRANLELKVGEGFHLGARVSPKNATNPRVTWSSDKESVATVGKEDGQVKAVAAGNAVITVTTVDGGFTATCPVTVTGGTTPDPPAPPTPSDPGAPAAFGAVPTEGQLAWQRQELLMFYHYGQATFSGWDGENPNCNGKAWSESLLLQNYKPTTIDADQWVKTAKDNGFGEIIITAKHHDGFCLWDNPESTTDVANAGCSNHTDVLQALREACNKYGVNMGIYLSPWDRMIEVSGKSTAEYEKMYKNALKDLMTKYAPVVEMWFDGNHAGNFDWASVNQVVFDANPQCVMTPIRSASSSPTAAPAAAGWATRMASPERPTGRPWTSRAAGSPRATCPATTGPTWAPATRAPLPGVRPRAISPSSRSATPTAGSTAPATAGRRRRS